MRIIKSWPQEHQRKFFQGESGILAFAPSLAHTCQTFKTKKDLTYDAQLKFEVVHAFQLFDYFGLEVQLDAALCDLLKAFYWPSRFSL